MSNSPNIAVLATAVAGIVTVAVAGDQPDLWDTIVGIILSAILIAYGRYPEPSWLERFIFGSIASLCLVLTLAPLLGFIIKPQQWLFLLGWFVLSILLMWPAKCATNPRPQLTAAPATFDR